MFSWGGCPRGGSGSDLSPLPSLPPQAPPGPPGVKVSEPLVGPGAPAGGAQEGACWLPATPAPHWQGPPGAGLCCRAHSLRGFCFDLQTCDSLGESFRRACFSPFLNCSR